MARIMAGEDSTTMQKRTNAIGQSSATCHDGHVAYVASLMGPEAGDNRRPVIYILQKTGTIVRVQQLTVCFELLDRNHKFTLRTSRNVPKKRACSRTL